MQSQYQQPQYQPQQQPGGGQNQGGGQPRPPRGQGQANGSNPRPYQPRYNAQNAPRMGGPPPNAGPQQPQQQPPPQLPHGVHPSAPRMPLGPPPHGAGQPPPGQIMYPNAPGQAGPPVYTYNLSQGIIPTMQVVSKLILQNAAKVSHVAEFVLDVAQFRHSVFKRNSQEQQTLITKFSLFTGCLITKRPNLCRKYLVNYLCTIFASLT